MKTPNYYRNFITDLFNNNNFILNKILNFIVLLIIIFVILFFLPNEKSLKLKIGDVLRQNIIAENNTKIIDNEATKKVEEMIRSTTPPTFVYDNKVVVELKRIITDYYNILLTSSKYQDIVSFNKMNKINISEDDYKRLKRIIIKNKDFLDLFLSIFNQIYDRGIVFIDDENQTDLQSSGIRIGKYNRNQLQYTLYSVEEINTAESIKNFLKYSIDDNFKKLDNNDKNSIQRLYLQIIKPNIFFNKEITELRLKNRIKTEAVVYKNLEKGEIIAKKDQIITENLLNEIKSTSNANNSYLYLKNIFPIAFFIFICILFLYLFINNFESKTFNDFNNYIFISVLLIINILYFSIPIYIGYDKQSIYYGLYVPISGFSVAVLFLYSRAFASFFTILLSLFLYFITGFNYYAFFFLLFSGLLTVFTISKLNRRTDLLLSSLIISFNNFIISLFIILLSKNTFEYKFSLFVIFAICNGLVSSVLATGIILLGEKLLDIATVFRLQELSLVSTHLLKSLFNSAIGTYNHSITVGNLAEAAASEIGANELLAKVGGYYHDIGKLENPEYFIENQSNYNKHDQLKPSISTAIIKAHVKIGVEKAKKEKLPKKVIDIISQHHGNTLIRFFYEEAVKNTESDKEEINRLDYQYQNKNPDFPESAIVLLADQVEAATRAIKKYTMTTIEKIIEKIIDDKFQEGILDDSGLTLKNLTKIKKIFCRLITGMYHPRIEYPESAEKNSSINNKNKQQKLTKNKS